MKYHIDTIPIWDAVKAETECGLCALRRKTERLLVERSLGASVMSPDSRVKVNDKGFCANHQAMMFQTSGGNRLGHGLMMLSHLQTIRPRIDKALGESKGKPASGGALSKLLKGNKGEPGQNNLEPFYGTCILCEEMDQQSKRQAASLIHLWKTDSAFKQAFAASKGLCVPDTALVMDMASELLSGEQLAAFRKEASQLLSENLKRLEDELEWFTLKFDYRNAQKPWGDSKDALERTVNKLRGWCLGSEPLQDDK